MEILKTNNLSKIFGSLNACSDINLELLENEILVILGESGSGKSTLLNLIAGFEVPSLGNVTLNGQLVSSKTKFIKPEKRGVGLLFQQDSMFPHFSIKKNINYAASTKYKKNFDDFLDDLDITDIKNKMPHECSGGERQRANLIRCLVNEPNLILMDEPFSSLDESSKINIRSVFYKYLKKNKIPSIVVSHDINDALILADKIAIMSNGYIIDFGKPKDLILNSKRYLTNQLFSTISVFNLVDIKNDNFLIKGKNISGHLFIDARDLEYSTGGELSTVWSKFHGDNYLNYLEYNKSKFYFFSDQDLSSKKIKLIIDLEKASIIL